MPIHNDFLGHSYFIREPIFKILVVGFRTHELQKDGMAIFFLWCFRKVRFRKMQFLKDGVQTVGMVRTCVSKDEWRFTKIYRHDFPLAKFV